MTDWLTPADRDAFQRIGVDDALLAAAGIRRVSTDEARDLGIRYRSPNLDGLWFPYHDPVTGVRVTGRLRRDHPEVDPDGKQLGKYLTPFGDTRRLFFPPGGELLLADTASSVVFVEAEKSSLALMSAAARLGRSLLAIATGGCWGWHGQIGRAEDSTGFRVGVKGPLPDLARIVMSGRDAIIAFDANAATNANVQAARRALEQELAAVGAIVRIADLPDEDGVNGPDDYLAAHGDAALLALIDTAKSLNRASADDLARQAGLHELTSDSAPDDIEGKVLSFSVLAGGRLKGDSAKWHAKRVLKQRGITHSADVVNAVFGAKRSQATQLVDLARESGAEWFHDRQGDAYATVPVDAHRETMAVNGRAMRQWLARQSHKATKTVPNSSALGDALNALAGLARFEGAEHPVYIRVASHGDDVYIDLGRSQWEAIHITSTGWCIVLDPPVKFRRTRGLLPLPLPLRGGSVDELRPFLNVDGDADFLLRVAWLVGALRGKGPYPVAALSGEQGSAKTFESALLRRAVDPNAAPVRLVPREGRDLMIAATNSHVVAFDNLSVIAPWLSDALCALASGTGFGTRELYTNDDEALFTAARPIIVNGIADVVTRPDLLDRALLLHCEPIPDERRRTEDDLNRAFELAHPGVLGALLDAVATALRNESSVHLARLSRMADFVRWTVAATPALPWSADMFLSAYAENRENATETSLDSDPLADAVRQLATSPLAGGRWEGTATQLLDEINGAVPPDHRGQRWFKRGKELSGALRRLAPGLRRVGVDVIFDRRDVEQHRLITIQRMANVPVLAVDAILGEACPTKSQHQETATRPHATTFAVVEFAGETAATATTASSPNPKGDSEWEKL